MVTSDRGVLPTPLRIMLTFILVWQFCFNISDVAIGVLMAFLYNFLRLLNSLWKSDGIHSLLEKSPRSYKSALYHLGLDKELFVQYVVCPKCDAIYDYKDCIQSLRCGKQCSATCSRIPFPNHPHASRRMKCGATLLRSVRIKGGRTNWHPRKSYCYRSLKDSVTTLVNRPGFLQSCEQWRSRVVPENVLHDVYNGQMWKEFQIVDGKPFLETPHNFVLALGCDWFQPFKHV